jgi:WD40 repeat protein
VLEPLQRFRGLDEAIDWCGLSRDGSRVLSLARGQATLWDARTGARLGLACDHPAQVTSCRFTADGTRIVAASDDRMLTVWDASSGELLHSHGIGDTAAGVVSPSPDGAGVLIGGVGLLELVDVSDGTIRAGYPTPEGFWVQRCATSRDGRRVIAVDLLRSHLAIWDAAGGRPLYLLARDVAYLSHLEEVNQRLHHDQDGWGFTPDGEYGLAVFFGGLKVVATRTGEERARLAAAPEDEWEWHPHRLNWSHLTAYAVSPAAPRVTGAFEDGAFICWTLDGREVRVGRVAEGSHRPYATVLEYSEDGSRLVAGTITGEVNAWATAGNWPAAKLGVLTGSIHSCAVSDDGRLVLAGSSEGELMLWDATAAR